MGLSHTPTARAHYMAFGSRLSWAEILDAACGGDDPVTKMVEAVLREKEREVSYQEVFFAPRWTANQLSLETLTPGQYAG